MNIKEKLFISWNVCLIIITLMFGYFLISRHINKMLQLNKLKGAIEYIKDTKGCLTQEDDNYFLNRIKEIEELN